MRAFLLGRRVAVFAFCFLFGGIVEQIVADVGIGVICVDCSCKNSVCVLLARLLKFCGVGSRSSREILVMEAWGLRLAGRTASHLSVKCPPQSLSTVILLRLSCDRTTIQRRAQLRLYDWTSNRLIVSVLFDQDSPWFSKTLGGASTAPSTT